MADSYASVDEVERLVANVNEAANKFKHAAGGDANLARRNLHLETQRLLASLEEPNLEVWPRTFTVSIRISCPLRY
jgi:hypothetical protein